MAATTIIPGYELADMNGPLGYWGPITQPTRRLRPIETALPARDTAALSRLGKTLNGRTWTGTNALMSALFATRAAVAA